MSSDVLFTETNVNDKATLYITSKDDKISITKCESNNMVNTVFSNFGTIFKDIFLPQGFPDSVHPDYIPYQMWDTVQASASTIMGTLTTHSILKGVGVGNASATPLAAAITWILKDGMGMIACITFTWWKGSDLDRQCKKWRFFADVLNDVAMGIELLVPYFSTYSMGILCVSTTMKSIVGVVGGATRAALTQHQALENNLADVSAKDRSQETCVNLIASLTGIFILSLFHDGRYLLELYLLLVSIHLYANYSAVKALRLNSFNEDRLCLTINNYVMKGHVPNPDVINKAESVMLLTRSSKAHYGFNIRMGTSLCGILQKKIVSPEEIRESLILFGRRRYLIVADVKQRIIFVCLTENAKSDDSIKAYFHACLFGLLLCMSLPLPTEHLLEASLPEATDHLKRFYTFAIEHPYKSNISCKIDSVRAANEIVDEEYVKFIRNAGNNGWDTTTNLLPVEASRVSWKQH